MIRAPEAEAVRPRREFVGLLPRRFARRLACRGLLAIAVGLQHFFADGFLHRKDYVVQILLALLFKTAVRRVLYCTPGFVERVQDILLGPAVECLHKAGALMWHAFDPFLEAFIASAGVACLAHCTKRGAARSPAVLTVGRRGQRSRLEVSQSAQPVLGLPPAIALTRRGGCYTAKTCEQGSKFKKPPDRAASVFCCERGSVRDSGQAVFIFKSLDLSNDK